MSKEIQRASSIVNFNKDPIEIQNTILRSEIFETV